MYMIAGMPGLPELMIILVIVVIFFGVGKLPNVMGQMGKGVKAFKEGMKESDLEKAQKAIDVTPDASSAPQTTEIVEDAVEG